MKKLFIIMALFAAPAWGQTYEQIQQEQGFQEDQQEIMRQEAVKKHRFLMRRLEDQQSQIDALQAQVNQQNK